MAVEIPVCAEGHFVATIIGMVDIRIDGRVPQCQFQRFGPAGPGLEKKVSCLRIKTSKTCRCAGDAILHGLLVPFLLPGKAATLERRFDDPLLDLVLIDLTGDKTIEIAAAIR